MSTPVTYVGNQYNVPAYQDTGYAQGTGNLSSYLIALATGSLTLAGGSFPLTADANFGGSFGLVSLYYKSRTASIATTGIVRLAATDAIEWSTSNYALTTDGSGNLTWRGSKIAGSTGAVSSITGTANQVIASAAVGDITLSLPQSIGTSSTPTFASETLAATTNQLVLGTTRTVTITAPTPASTSRTWTIPDISGNGTFAALEAIQTFSALNTFNSTSGVSIAPGGAGDAFIKYTINAGQAWTKGVDDSDSDSFVLSANASLGTTNVWKATSGGNITQPLQACFLATQGADANVTGDGTVYTMTFGTEVFDIGSNLSAGVFTAPVTGKYQFNIAMNAEGILVTHTIRSLQIVTTARTYTWESSYLLAEAFHSFSFSTLADMTVGDTAVAKFTVSGSTKVVDIAAGDNFFSGSLIN